MTRRFAGAVCFGFGHRQGRCKRPVDLEANLTGLWCLNCERARRLAIGRQMAQITRQFDELERYVEQRGPISIPPRKR